MQATWIWYPGDFEVWLGNRFNNRRTERGAMFPPFWKQDSHWPTVVFTTDVNLEEFENITIIAEGQYNLAVDGKLQVSNTIPAGHHCISIKVWNQATPPAIYVTGKTIHSNSAWLTTYEDKIWIDEKGVAHGSGIYVPVGCWNFDAPQTPPSKFRLERRELRPISMEEIHNANGMIIGKLYDFGREVFGYLRLSNQEYIINVYYGESREEALDKEYCETLDHLSPGHREPDSKAFRYVYVEGDYALGAWWDDVWMEYEYAPFDERHSGSFRCSDDELNRIWEVAAYTLDLTTREFFCDGIKRDRWVWSGDAIQSYLMNYYLRFDSECVKRTIRQLRGKDPVTAHVNTIMDYTFYWFVSIEQYYAYTGDIAFIREIYPKMRTLMDYVLKRLNSAHMPEGQPDDWVFVDWVDFPMSKRGTLCFEQMLFYQALETMRDCAKMLSADAGDAEITDDTEVIDISDFQDDYLRYGLFCNRAWEDIQKLYSPKHHAFLHAIEGEGEGRLNEQVTKFPNIFAIIYNLASLGVKRDILEHVLLNDKVPPITTPYMRFYELDALCMMGLRKRAIDEMRAYWGGMLREGATTFWEKYNPEEKGTEHLAMYGRPYGKSLCHAWGASPIYIIGKYLLGVRPTKPGYKEYVVQPTLAGLQWIKGDVPTPLGLIHVELDRKKCLVRGNGGHGTLILGNDEMEIPPRNTINIAITYNEKP